MTHAANALRVELVDFNHIVKDIFQVGDVAFAHTLGYSLIDLDDEIYLLDHIRLGKTLRVAPGSLNCLHPVVVAVLKELEEVGLLVVLLCRDHVADALIDHEPLVGLQVLAVFG